jgi:cell division protein FtsB
MIRTLLRGTERPVGAPSPPRRQYEGPWLRRGILFVSCALALNALIGDRGLGETFRARRELQHTTTELALLKHQNASLLRQAGQLKSDSRTIEHIARSELGLIRPGEVLVVVKDVPAR